MKQGFELDDNETLSDIISGRPVQTAGQRRNSQQSGTAAQDPAGSADTAGMRAGFTVSVSRDEMQTAKMPDTDTDDDAEEKLPETRIWSNPALWILLLIVCFFGLETYTLIKEAFDLGSPAGIAWCGIFGFLFLAAFWSLTSEFQSLLLFKDLDQHRREALKVRSEGSCSEALTLCRSLAVASGISGSKIWQGFEQRVVSHLSADEVFALYEKTVLADLDTKARQIIVRRSREIGVIVALSPVAWFDMLLSLIRSMRMIREIAEVYGLKPGLFGRMQIYRRVMRNLVYIGMIDLATDSVIDVIGAGLAGKLSAAAGQGVAAGILATRLGYMTIKAVRPLGLNREVLTLGDLRRDLLSGGRLADLARQGRS